MDDGQTHLLELSKLAEKDPEFYKYLQENDRELLEFDLNGEDEDDDMSDGDGIEAEKTPVLTLQDLRTWSKALLKVSKRLPGQFFGLTKPYLASVLEGP